MKKTLKTLSLALATVIASMSLVSFAHADHRPGYIATTRITYEKVDYLDLELDGEYIIVAGDDLAGNADEDVTTGYVLTANEFNHRLSSTSVEVWYGEEIEGGSDCLGVHYGLSNACVWQVVDYDGKFCLRNKQTGTYLGNLFGLYTWDNKDYADLLAINQTSFGLCYPTPNGYVCQTLQFDEAGQRFYLNDEAGTGNIHIFKRHEIVW